MGGLALFLALGGPRIFHKGSRTSPPVETQQQMSATKQPTGQADAPLDYSGPSFKNSLSKQPDNQIFSLDWLEQNGKKVKKLSDIHLTYYLLANSRRCSLDSLAPCIREKIKSNGIDALEYQFTYFLDRVMIAGSGEMEWDKQRYVTHFNLLRDAGWNSGVHAGQNNYTCRDFKFKDKNGLEFIKQNIKNNKVFIRRQDHDAPNGRTFSGQEAVDWHTVSVNLHDFPLSVPEGKRRNQLAKKLKSTAIAGLYSRSFIVIKTRDGKMFLTEAMDTGTGVKNGWIDWRIGNSSDQIKYFLSLESPFEATCYTFDDPQISLTKVLSSSKNFTKK